MAEHVCPVWVGYLLASPLRKILQNPDRILSPHVKAGMTAVDLGSAMGFFSLPMARMTGTSGRVVCVDMQEKMLNILEKRARKAGVPDVVETRVCEKESLGMEDLRGKVDFILACYMVHEVPDIPGLFSQAAAALRTSGRMLVLEPRGHVSPADFQCTVSIARENGLQAVGDPRVRRSLTVLLEKPGP